MWPGMRSVCQLHTTQMLPGKSCQTTSEHWASVPSARFKFLVPEPLPHILPVVYFQSLTWGVFHSPLMFFRGVGIIWKMGGKHKHYWLGSWILIRCKMICLKCIYLKLALAGYIRISTYLLCFYSFSRLLNADTTGWQRLLLELKILFFSFFSFFALWPSKIELFKYNDYCRKTVGPWISVNQERGEKLIVDILKCI